jgi:hypothetical protein
MIPALPKVIECPHCSKKALKRGLISGNTIGAIFWSDGKMEASMLPEFPEVVKCKYCSKFYWIENAKVVGTLSFEEKLSTSLKYVSFPSSDEYKELLTSDVIKKDEEERYVRIRLWWSLNDPVRGKDEGKTSVPNWDLFKSNLNQLLQLLSNEIPRDRIMMAEINREMGNFNKAIEILEYKWPSKLGVSAAEILSMSKLEKNVVFPLTEDMNNIHTW